MSSLKHVCSFPQLSSELWATSSEVFLSLHDLDDAFMQTLEGAFLEAAHGVQCRVDAPLYLQVADENGRNKLL